MGYFQVRYDSRVVIYDRRAVFPANVGQLWGNLWKMLLLFKLKLLWLFKVNICKKCSQCLFVYYCKWGLNLFSIVIKRSKESNFFSYPFDGVGMILAHAYYPYEFGSFGGDIHFDEDEDWRPDASTSNEGLDFFTVAVWLLPTFVLYLYLDAAF